MDSPILKVKAKDNADSLDNLLSVFGRSDRMLILEYLWSTFRDIEFVLVNSLEESNSSLALYRTFVARIEEYMPNEYTTIGLDNP